jgi:hypothetical protein
MHHVSRPGLFVTFFVTLAACEAAPEDLAAEHDRFAVDLTRAYCEAVVRCPDPSSIDLAWRPVLRTADRCVAMFGPQLGDTLRRYRAVVTAGRARFNAAEAQRCVETVRGVCNHDLDLLLNRYCARVYAGTAPTGAPCRLTAECAGEARCQTFGSPCGVCLPRAALGGACAGGYDACARAATGWSECDVAGLSGATSGVCRAGRLVTGAAAGDACGVRRTASGVIERVVCAAGAWCAAPRDGQGECRAHRAVGDACAEGDVCEGDALCVTEGGSGTCRAQTIVDAEGGACGTREGSPRCDPVTNLVSPRRVPAPRRRQRGRPLRVGHPRRLVRRGPHVHPRDHEHLPGAPRRRRGLPRQRRVPERLVRRRRHRRAPLRPHPLLNRETLTQCPRTTSTCLPSALAPGA